MGTRKLKTRIVMASALAIIAAGVMSIAGDASGADGATGHGKGMSGAVQTAAYGGVLVPKRVRIVVGFVQTLPA